MANDFIPAEWTLAEGYERYAAALAEALADPDPEQLRRVAAELSASLYELSAKLRDRAVVE
jgi:hypothetical protein